MKKSILIQSIFFTFFLLVVPGTVLRAQNGAKPKTKKVIEYYPDSVHVKYEYTVVLVDTAPFEIKNGHYKWFYEDGKLKARSWFAMGVRDSVYTSYYRSGGLKEEVIYRNGKLNGPGKSYYPGGGVENMGEYVNDLKNGTWKYYENGTLLRVEKWDKGKKLE